MEADKWMKERKDEAIKNTWGKKEKKTYYIEQRTKENRKWVERRKEWAEVE